VRDSGSEEWWTVVREFEDDETKSGICKGQTRDK
jgi:hypothetical protein